MRGLRVAAPGLLLAACSVAAPSASAPPSPTPTPFLPSIPAASPTATAPPSAAATWPIAWIPPMFPGGSAMPVAVAASEESGLVAVGSREFRDPAAPAGGTAGAWRSDDGVAWEPADPGGLAVGDVVPGSGPEAGLVDVAWGPVGFVAVGYAYEEAGDSVDLVGGAWHSPDGRSWSRSGDPLWALARPTAVTWTGTRFVAVGVVEAEAAPRAAAWYSADGVTWKRAPDAPVFDIGTYLDTLEYHAWAGPIDLTTGEDGALLVVGRTCRDAAEPGEAACDELVWRSADGLTWTREEIGAAAADVSLSSIATSGGQVVVVGGPRLDSGTGADPARVLVRQADGWLRVAPPGIPRLGRVIQFGTGFIAASGTGLWSSVTGEAWAPVAGFPSISAQAFDVSTAGNELVYVGWTSGYPDGQDGGFAVVAAPTAN